MWGIVKRKVESAKRLFIVEGGWFSSYRTPREFIGMCAVREVKQDKEIKLCDGVVMCICMYLHKMEGLFLKDVLSVVVDVQAFDVDVAFVLVVVRGCVVGCCACSGAGCSGSSSCSHILHLNICCRCRSLRNSLLAFLPHFFVFFLCVCPFGV